MMLCFSPPYLLVPGQGRRAGQEMCMRGSSCTADSSSRCHGSSPFSLSLVSHSTEPMWIYGWGTLFYQKIISQRRKVACWFFVQIFCTSLHLGQDRDPRTKREHRCCQFQGGTTEGPSSGRPWGKSLRDFLRDTHPACCSSEQFSFLFASALAGITASPQRSGEHD